MEKSCVSCLEGVEFVIVSSVQTAKPFLLLFSGESLALSIFRFAYDKRMRWENGMQVFIAT